MDRLQRYRNSKDVYYRERQNYTSAYIRQLRKTSASVGSRHQKSQKRGFDAIYRRLVYLSYFIAACVFSLILVIGGFVSCNKSIEPRQDGEGSAVCVTRRVFSASKARIEFQFVVGKSGIGPNGCIVF